MSEILPFFFLNIQTQVPKLTFPLEENSYKEQFKNFFFQAQVLFAWQLQIRAHKIVFVLCSLL